MNNNSTILSDRTPDMGSALPLSNPDDVPLEVFLNTFSAAHLARPLPSFDAHTPDEVLQAAMTRSGVPVVSLRSAGLVCGWRTAEEIARGVPPTSDRPFPQQVVDQSASFQLVISELARSPWLLVRSLEQVNGVIQLADIDRPPMRMWLFGLITVMELRINRLIEQLLPDDRWTKYLSSGRLQKALGLRDECQRQGETRRLVDCLQFADKGRIISCDEDLRRLTRFQTKRQVETFAFDLQILRNKLSHALALSAEWTTIVDLVNNISRIAQVRTSV
jgi:hypothetical protein